MRFQARFFPCLILALSLASVRSQAAHRSQGDQAFRAGDFATAATAYASEHSQNPKDVQVLLRMGDLALFADKLTEAERDYRGALAIDPTNKWATRSLTDIQRRRGSGDEFTVKDAGATAIVPFIATDPLPVIRVKLDGGRDANFLIDTGAPAVALDPSVAKELGLKIEDAGMGVFAGGLRAPIRVATLGTISCGQVSVDHVPVSVMPLEGAPAPKGVHLDGILGTSFFYHFLATLDYSHGQLILAPRTTSAAFELSAQQRGDSSVPLWYVPDHFLFAQARVNDGAVRLFNIDTGGEGMGLQATQDTVKDAHIVLDEAHKTRFSGGGGDVTTIPFHAAVTVGTTTVRDLPGQYFPDGDQYGIFPFEVGGTISHEFFRHLAVTFDFTAMRMVLTR
ncbi:MAG TPA: aspartyl protease family protein [Nitrospira sp.]|nr:aspartyl protease family protein [Nitrospira sp.]